MRNKTGAPPEVKVPEVARVSPVRCQPVRNKTGDRTEADHHILQPLRSEVQQRFGGHFGSSYVL